MERGKPSEYWRKYGGSRLPEVLDNLLGEVRLVERPMLLLLGKAKGKDVVELNSLLPNFLKRRALAHELGHLVAASLGELEPHEEEYVARAIEHYIFKGRLPQGRKTLGITSTLLPSARRRELLEGLRRLLEGNQK